MNKQTETCVVTKPIPSPQTDGSYIFKANKRKQWLCLRGTEERDHRRDQRNRICLKRLAASHIDTVCSFVAQILLSCSTLTAILCPSMIHLSLQTWLDSVCCIYTHFCTCSGHHFGGAVNCFQGCHSVFWILFLSLANGHECSLRWEWKVCGQKNKITLTVIMLFLL